jgi:hypothetical protein
MLFHYSSHVSNVKFETAAMKQPNLAIDHLTNHFNKADEKASFCIE